VALARKYSLNAQRTWHTAQAPNAMLRTCDLTAAGQPYQPGRSIEHKT